MRSFVYLTVSNSSESETPSARASRNRFLKEGSRRAVSIPLSYVLRNAQGQFRQPLLETALGFAAPLRGCRRWWPTDQRRELGLRLQPI